MYLSSPRELKHSGDEIQIHVREGRCDRFRVGSKKNLFASKLKARDSATDSFLRICIPQWRNLRGTAKFHVIM